MHRIIKTLIEVSKACNRSVNVLQSLHTNKTLFLDRYSAVAGANRGKNYDHQNRSYSHGTLSPSDGVLFIMGLLSIVRAYVVHKDRRPRIKQAGGSVACALRSDAGEMGTAIHLPNPLEPTGQNN